MNQFPLVSIIVSCYKCENYILDTVDSILNQTYPNIEVIMADDCSPDNTYKLLRTREKDLNNRFQRVIIYQNEKNLGVTKSLNGLLKHTEGKFIKFLDSDDMLLTDAVTDLVAYMQLHDEYAFVFGDVYLGKMDTIYQKSNQYNAERMLNNNVTVNNNCFRNLYFDNFIPSIGVLIRKSVVDKYGLFDENIGIEDWEYWLRITQFEKIGYYSKPVALYRINDESMTHYRNSQDGEKKFCYILSSEIKILEKYRNAVGIYSYYRILRYDVFQLEYAYNLGYELAINLLKEYIAQKGWLYLHFVQILLKMVSLIKKCKKDKNESNGR